MDKRQAIGSWLSGPRETAEQMGVDFGYPGKQLGLPQQGPGSVARFGRRFGAVLIDWLACQLIAYGLITGRDWTGAGNWTLGLFVLLSILTVGTVGFTPGKRILGIRVIRQDGSRLGIGRVILRTVLLALVIPALVWDRDGRGLHDRVSHAVQVRI
ncbi:MULTISPECIES: RDD family protein [unclassified Streptomyces]|uniref:RDD family protein n=1 Tax=unclassified Streptomyces TaxID=2593676 RepID=UPI000DC7E6CC|nr:MULTISPECIES: RDD family protein [unclassified Streptomyces]AWZ05040.1 RDD family protein [Streptomyces sp. ICC4]AWZ11227.1 RDD family protein [Streptomyces sp. ICC1]